MTLLNEAGWPTFLLLFALAMLTLFLARTPAHGAINSLFQGLYGALRLLSKAVSRQAKHIKERNQEVLLTLGREQSARELRKEFHEISQFVQKDLGGYPDIQQQVRTQVTEIQNQYENSQAAAMEIPEWTDAVSSLATLKSNPSPHTKVLEQIHSTAVNQHKENVRVFNDANSKRYRALHKILPYWRKLAFSIDDLGASLGDVIKRSERIDAHMARYEAIEQRSDKAVRMLGLSALTQFVISLLVILIAAGGAFFNFHLIALPMSEMVGSVQRIGGVKVSDLAALVIICMEMCAGIFLLESLRITKLFPMISSMDNRTRHVIAGTALTVLVTLACTESALAFMRDQIANDLAALRTSLAGGTYSVNTSEQGAQHWIPLAANMVLGFVLPIALTMIAIPLEYLLQSARTVLGGVLGSSLSLLATGLRLLSFAAKQLGRICIYSYDILIAGPLSIEAAIKKSATRRENTSEPPWSDNEIASLEDTLSGAVLKQPSKHKN